MSEFTRQLLPVLFMYFCILGLVPLVWFTLWASFDGDRARSEVRTQEGEAHPPTDQA